MRNNFSPRLMAAALLGAIGLSGFTRPTVGQGSTGGRMPLPIPDFETPPQSNYPVRPRFRQDYTAWNRQVIARLSAWNRQDPKPWKWPGSLSKAAKVALHNRKRLPAGL